MPKKPKPAEPDELQATREEAERLAELPVEEQRAVIAWHRAIAADPKVKKANREAARQRAEALARLLRKNRTK